MTALYEAGLISGVQEQDALLFQPDNSITRAQISAVVWQVQRYAGSIHFGSYVLEVLPGVPVNPYDPAAFQLRGDRIVQDILGDCVTPAAPEDWDAEYGDYILAVRVVSGLEEAIDFINEHGTGHSECIVTRNYFHAQTFLDQVDAAAVYVNASTRFTDGGEFGLGAEIGISTQKMHARGPMGLEELTSCKYVIYGEGQVR